MFGCPADQIRSFSETYSLIPDSEEENENCDASGRILTSEEFIERFKNRVDIFSIDENIKLTSSEIITILCAILACSTCGEEEIKQTRWPLDLLDLFQITLSDMNTRLLPVSKYLDDHILDVMLQSQLTANGNYCLQNVDTIAISFANVSENGLNIRHELWAGCNRKTSYLSQTAAPRGPPLQISIANEAGKIGEYMSSLKCKNTVNSIMIYDVFTKDKIDTGIATLIGNNECNYTSGLLHYCKNISSLLLQADRRYPV